MAAPVVSNGMRGLSRTQARSLDEVAERIREAIELCLEVEGAPQEDLEFIGIQRVTVAA